jgi:hypothetical protein
MTRREKLDEFLRKWKTALRNRETFERAYWEGQDAYSDLKRTGYLERVCLEEKDDEPGFGSGPEHFIAKHALPKICAELRVYRRDLNRVRALIGFQKDQYEWLDKHARALGQKAKLVASKDSAFADDLVQLAKRVDEVKRGIRFRLREHWRHPSLDFLNPYEGHGAPRQERQLDSRFQVRLGVVLRSFMRKYPVTAGGGSGPSLRTIARLIVLFLVCADLAEVKQGQVTLKHNNRRITVGGVLQQLRGAGIDRLTKQ